MGVGEKGVDSRGRGDLIKSLANFDATVTFPHPSVTFEPSYVDLVWSQGEGGFTGGCSSSSSWPSPLPSGFHEMIHLAEEGRGDVV